ncbi:DNA repair protein RecN [Leptolyngbya sp. AN02str]|uniref:DNA repair protein RecN n=1 Tax=Leptolyngbya sp. AN02str TaxID=3423363 RepID=UPI003D31D2A6
MLISLHIENFALVDRLTLDFGSGLNVLTGETGAGKSIILDALDAALGGKVSGRAIRAGENRALIEATFALDASLEEWLGAQEIDVLDEPQVVCSRELTANKGSVRSRSRVNGVLVNKQQLESLRDRLVEITAQGQTVQLGQPSLQREWLDGFGGAAALQQREVIAKAYAAYQQAAQALEKRRQMEQQRLQQLDLFEYQLKELEAANLAHPDELTQLEQERQRLSHTVELKQQSYEVYQALYENDAGQACSDLLGRVESVLTEMVQYDTELQPILEMVIEAMSQVEEAGRQINAYGEDLETDPDRLSEVEQRIVQLKGICRKYGPSLADAIAHYQRLQADLESIMGGGQSLEALEQQAQVRQTELVEACAVMTDLRTKAARSLEAQLVDELKPLAMEKVQFEVNITPIAPTAAGSDRIMFVFSPNPGEPLQALSEIASGGEMSRFLLALKACFSQVDPIGTMVFDEIDTGVSGRVAQAIAEKLYQLGQRHQVLCVTHQPLIAAMATSHFRVGKHIIDLPTGATSRNGGKRSEAAESADGADDVRTVVRVTELADQERKREIAALVGGTDQEAIAFAESLLNQAAQTRNNYGPSATESVEAKISEPEASSPAILESAQQEAAVATPAKRGRRKR